MSFIAGDFIRYTAQFNLEPYGAPKNPTEVVFIYSIGGMPQVQIKYYTGASVTGQIFNPGVGEYYVDIDTTNNPGSYESIWASRGSPPPNGSPQVISSPTTITVTEPAFTPSF